MDNINVKPPTYFCNYLKVGCFFLCPEFNYHYCACWVKVLQKGNIEVRMPFLLTFCRSYKLSPCSFMLVCGY